MWFHIFVTRKFINLLTFNFIIAVDDNNFYVDKGRLYQGAEL